MNLIIDAGNTNIKYAVYKRDVLVDFRQSAAAEFSLAVKKVFDDYPEINRAMLSSVTCLDKQAMDVLCVFTKVKCLDHTTRVPFKNSYATPSTLGPDRIALATAAFYNNPHRNTLVVDAGSCITYDMVNDYGEYLGGAISPGLRMRYRALHEYTAKLPQLEPEHMLDFIGNSTAGSIHSGVVNGTCREIDGVIDQYRRRYDRLKVILTGGDAQFLSKRLKNTIFAHPKFLLEGLNLLLEYNKR